MGKYGKTGMCLFLCMVFLSGCGQANGPDKIESTTLVLNGKGSVTAYLVGNFAREYYSLQELENMVTGEASGYNDNVSVAGQDDVVKVETVELLESDSSKAMITFRYDSVDTYCDYNDVELFYGTVNEAIAAGYALKDEDIFSVKDGSQAQNGYLRQQASKQHVLITQEHIIFYCPYSVTYISDGAVLNEDGSVDMRACEGTGIILMKK
ncbi:MAG: hypothetical protein J1E64_04040 [Acetatifactor sp.]|nr:hypothetical protein [Acetatifactor sp.]